MNNFLLHRINTPLVDLLREAISKGDIKKQYAPFQPRRAEENESDFIERVRNFSLKYQFVEVLDNISNDTKYVAFGTPGPIITEAGEFQYFPAEVVGGKWGKHHILIYPDIDSLLKENIIKLRIDSGCYSGAVLGDITCDCEQQLRLAQTEIINSGNGLIITVPEHDGRGWKEFKMANQTLMKVLNFSTIEAAHAFYSDENHIDRRDYDEVALIIKALGFNSEQNFDLATNNKKKVRAVLDAGLNIGSIQQIIPTELSSQAKRNFDSKSDVWGINK